ncbi:HpcH/HpaI aldolase/citrate lyase family protein [Candidatus Neomarinimicrobiota bacterium]
MNTASPIIAEIMSNAGFDFLVVDAEHSAVDIPQTLAIFQAIQAGNQNCVPIVRLPSNEYWETKRYLDAGARGVIAPLINSAEQAQELVRSVKYPPMGERGVGFGRSHGYGFNFDDYMKSANEETFICVQIEHVKAIENIEHILSVEGVDAILIGPYDLTASMGITGQFEHSKYLDTLNLILASCKRHAVLAGIHVVQPDPGEVLMRIEQGFQLIGYSLDITMIGNESRKALDQIRR